MEDSMIKSTEKSPNTLDEILNQDNQKAKTNTDAQQPELSKASSVPVDHKNKIDQNIYNFNALEIRKQSANPNEEGIVESLKNSDILLPIILIEDEMTKPCKSRVSCKKETTKSISDDKKTGKNTTRKVLAEKQILSIPTCDTSGIFLRSRRKKVDLGENLINSNKPMSDENEVKQTSRNRMEFKNRSQSIDEMDCNPLKENVPKELWENSRSLVIKKQDEAKIRTRRSIPYESLSLMEKIIIREHEMLESICNKNQSTNQENDDRVLNNEEKSLTDESKNDSTQNDMMLKKKFHRRKCSEPFKNERTQTRQSCSITSMQNKNEYKYFSQDPKTGKCSIPFESDNKGSEQKTPAEECANICTSDENQNPVSSSVDGKNNQELGYKENPYALNVAKKSPAGETSLSSKNESKCTPTDSMISINEASSQSITEHAQLSRKRGQDNSDDNPKRKLRHVNAQPMPVYTSKIAVTKNQNKSKTMAGKSLLLYPTRNKGNNSRDTDHDKAEKRGENPVVIEKESQHSLNIMSLRSRIDKTTDSKVSYLSNTDSEDTLSNVESVPNSPAQDTWPKLAGKNLKSGNKRVTFNPVHSISHIRETSLITNRTPPNIVIGVTENKHNTELNAARKHKCSETEMASNSNGAIDRGQSELRYYVETTANPKPLCISDVSDKNAKNDSRNDAFREPQETPWLRHYERPHKNGTNTAKHSTELKNNERKNSSRQNQNSYHQQRKDVETTKKASCSTSITDNLHSTEGFTLRNRSGRLPEPVMNPPLKKRGRPRKEDTQKSEINSKGNKRKGPSTSRTPLNGSGLSKLELERLFFKFLQHGHFRVEPGQPTIIIHNNDLYENYSPRTQCYDPRKYHSHPYNSDTISNTGSKTYPHSQQNYSVPHNDCNRFYPSNNCSSGEVGHRLRTMNSNPHNFSDEFSGQTTYSRNQSPCTTQTNIHSYPHSDKSVINDSGFNTIANTNSPSNYAQSGYSTGPNYHQNFYTNTADVVENNSYSDNYTGINNINSNGFMYNPNTGTAATNLLSTTNSFENDFNFISNSQSTPYREIDFTMSNGNTISGNSMSPVLNNNSPTYNVNLDWNLSSTNQHLNSANGFLIDVNSMNNMNDSRQPINGNPDLNNVMNNVNSMMNTPNSWMNRTNNMINTRFPVMPTWHTSLPMYNSYLNNSNAYYNMFNPYTAFTGIDLSNGCMNSKNGMGMNNENSWMQNTLQSNNGLHSTYNSTNTEFSNITPGSLQENTFNQGMNLSLSSETIINQTNSIKLDGTDLDMGNGNELNPNNQQLKEDTFEQLEADNNNDMHQSYYKETCSPYSLGYKNDTQNIDFDDVKISNIDENNVNSQQQEQNLSEIEDYMNRASESIENCMNQSYGQTGPLSCDIIADLPNNRQTEMSKLRQELADFTRQYSEDQMNSTSDIPQGDEIFI